MSPLRHPTKPASAGFVVFVGAAVLLSPYAGCPGTGHRVNRLTGQGNPGPCQARGRVQPVSYEV